MRLWMGWPVAAVMVVALGIAGAHADRGSQDSVIIDLRAPPGAADRVILTLHRQSPVRLSLAAVDEAALFGINVAHHKREAVAPVPQPAVVVEAPIKRAELRQPPRRETWTRTRAGARHVARSRKAKRSRGLAKAPPAVASAATTAVAAALPTSPAPVRAPRKAIALRDEYQPVEESPKLGFKLGQRTSLRVGSLSSMVAPAANDDELSGFKHPSRSNDEVEAWQRSGAAVGLTFDLN